MRIISVISFLLLSLAGLGQQDAIYSQYMFNHFAINPAYAGSRDAVNVAIIGRNQWVGLDGAPVTQTASVHAPTRSSNLAWGANLSNDKLGPVSNRIAMGSIAYQLRQEKGTLNFGLRGGIYNSVFDNSVLKFREENDALESSEKLSSIVPTFDFGLYYYTERFYTGLSVTHITRHRFNYESLLNNQAYFLRRHVFFSAGYVFELNNKILVKPSTLLKYTAEGGLNADLNANIMFNELFWVGAGIRNFTNLNFLIDFNITDYLRIGYAYDLTLNKLKNYSNGSHEILIGFDFNFKKTTTVSPRYL